MCKVAFLSVCIVVNLWNSDGMTSFLVDLMSGRVDLCFRS